ncbi:hypothetical protein [Yersinia mollaretii]|nr:hypothetical protein [Yersinia mollaretii]
MFDELRRDKAASTGLAAEFDNNEQDKNIFIAELWRDELLIGAG